MARAFLLILALAAAVLGWGAWHVSTHGFVLVTVRDSAQANAQLRGVQLDFADAQGQPVASGEVDELWGAFAAKPPGREMEWAPRVRQARVKVGACTIEAVPVEVERSADAWWLWWVPLPHVGGKPSTTFTFTLWVDANRCRPAAASGTA